ncbi:MAG: GNAT family acetyltransferase [Trueperaceae bacterium]
MTSALHIRRYQPTDADPVVELWQRCELVVPWNDPHEDIARKSSVQPELFLVGTVAGLPVATVMAGFDGHRGWLNYLAVSPDHRGRSFGRRIVQAAEERLAALGCPKINLQIRASNHAVVDFYRRLGYGVDEVVSMGKRMPTP